MALALVYDPRYHTFESWAALMCEAYGGQQLEIPSADTNWVNWAQGLIAIDLFSVNAVPAPTLFAEWYEWAEQLVNAINQRV
jgi:hypothetical protein